MYSYKSKVGTFWIKPTNDNRWALGIGDEVLGSYASPIPPANQVYTHTTGYNPWDILDGTIFDAPTDVYEWKRHN
jgi:hypothetical protein